MRYLIKLIVIKALRIVFGTSHSEPFIFPTYLLNTPKKSAQLAEYLQKTPQLNQYFKPIFDDDLLRAHDLYASGVRFILHQKKMPIELYTSRSELSMFLNNAAINTQYIAIVSSAIFQNDIEQKDDTHFHAIVYEKFSNNTASLYVYDPYKGFKISPFIQRLFSQLNITLYSSDTPRSYALKGTSFAYAINDAEKLLQAPAPNRHEVATLEDGNRIFKLDRQFRYNGLEAKREYFQFLVDNVEQSKNDIEIENISTVLTL